MATPAYMWIKDEKGMPISGNVEIKGREHSIEVTGFSHEIYIPNDRDTGSLTGTRKHQPFWIIKEFDSTSPTLHKACCSGRSLQEIILRWYKINDRGEEQEYYHHRLSNAKVVAINPYMTDVKDKSQENHGHMEKVYFRYEKIQWLFLEGNIFAEDDWLKRT